jgi:hypothetical protein
MSLQQVLDEIITLAEIVLTFSGNPEYAALLAAVVPKLDKLIQNLIGNLAQKAEWTPEEQAAFQVRIDAITNDPAWQLTP